jgi:DNA-binding response OmpR family regulator
MTMQEKILLVDDDEALAAEMGETLEQYGYAVAKAHEWTSAMSEIARFAPDLIVLDQRLGRVDTLVRLAELRAQTPVPVIVLTGNECAADRIIGLETGADDFQIKPITPRELVARIRANLRRMSEAAPKPASWRIVPREFKVYAPDGTTVPLSSAEFALLECLHSASGEPLSREELSQRVLRRPYRVDDRSIDNVVYQVRQKIRKAGGGDAIVALRGRGYAFAGFETGD